MNGEKSRLLKISALWKKIGKTSGETYLIGNLGDARLLILKNKRKERENQPDFIVYLCEPTPKPAPPAPGPTPFDNGSQTDDGMPYSKPNEF